MRAITADWLSVIWVMLAFNAIPLLINFSSTWFLS
jgi:hypothetical protein